MERINPVLERLKGTAVISDLPTDEWSIARRHLKSHNDYAEPPGDTGYDCPKCRNKQTIFYLAENQDGSPRIVGRACKCAETRASIRKMQRSGLGNIIADNQFDKYEASAPWQQTLKEAAQAYAGTLQGWFFVGGQSGAGKTHLCTAICREALLKGKGVAYMMWRDDAPKLKAKVNDSDYGAAVDSFKKADVLYIDDLFKAGQQDGHGAKPTSADINLAFEIINHRYVGKLPTIISTEFTLDELIELDEATAGRIAERSGACTWSIQKDRKKNYRLRQVGVL